MPTVGLAHLSASLMRALVQTLLKYVSSDPFDRCVIWLVPDSSWGRDWGNRSINISDFLKLSQFWSSSSPSGPVVTAVDCSLKRNHITLAVVVGLLPIKRKQLASMTGGLKINLHFPLVLRSMKLGIQVDWLGARQTGLAFKRSFHKASHQNTAWHNNDQLFLSNTQICPAVIPLLCSTQPPYLNIAAARFKGIDSTYVQKYGFGSSVHSAVEKVLCSKCPWRLPQF